MPDIIGTEVLDKQIAPLLIDGTLLVEGTREEELLEYVKVCISGAEDYRGLFAPVWTDIENQLRCVHPAEWNKKEKWQTKVYIPLQAKTSEIVFSRENEVLFAGNRFYDIQGEEGKDRIQDEYVMRVMDNTIERMDFFQQKDFALREAIDLGTSFLKILPNGKQDGFICTWRSCMHCLVDPIARHDFYKSRFWIDEYKKDLGMMIEEAKNGTGLYSMASIMKLLKQGELMAKTQETKEDELMVIRSIDNSADLKIEKSFNNVTIHEFWGKVKVYKKKKYDEGGKKWIEYYEYENKVVTVANKCVVLRIADNPTVTKDSPGFLPVIIYRTKERKYDLYGAGYFENTRGLQELTNSMVCLGFDSAKINALDIAVIDESKIADETSIEYRPIAIWKVKGNPREAVDIRRNNISSLTDVMRGVGIIDSMHQDASGVTRQIAGSSPTPGTPGAGDETLGEYKLKLGMVDKRFLDQARKIEAGSIVPMIHMLYRYIKLPGMFTQAAVDRILGKVEVKKPVLDLQGNQIGEKTQLESKLLLSELAPTMDYDFKATGVTKFYQKLELSAKLERFVLMAENSPLVLKKINFDRLFERLLQMSDIPDYKELLNQETLDMEKLAPLIMAMKGGMGNQKPDLSGNTDISNAAGG